MGRFLVWSDNKNGKVGSTAVYLTMQLVRQFFEDQE